MKTNQNFLKIDMKFPIIVVKENDPMVYVYESMESLRKTSEELLNSNIWSDSKLIDSGGYEREVLAVTKSGLRGIFGWHPLLKGKSIWVDYQFSKEKKIEIDSFKRLLLSRLELTQSFWEESYDINELKKEIEQLQTFESLINLFK